MVLQLSTTKPQIFTVDLGTYCDNMLLMDVLRPYFATHDVVVLADDNHEIPKTPNITRYTYSTPRFILEDASMDLADPHQSMIFWTLTNPFKAYQAAKWASTMKSKVLQILKQHKRITTIVILYPAFSVLAQIPKDVLDNYQVSIVYYAPGLPFKEIPWVFDSVLRDPKFKLYKKPNNHYHRSTLSYFQRLATFTHQSLDTILQKFTSFTHIMSWNQVSVPTLTPAIPLTKIKYIGAILYIPNPLPPLPKLIDCIIQNHKHIIFLTFGSYGNNKYIQDHIPNLLNHLTTYCAKHPNTHVIYHNGNYTNQHITSYKGHIPYETILQKTQLVIFTGSVCLQNLCLYYRTPMLFVPILTEQYFWAKNYAHFTRIALYSLTSPTPPPLTKAITSPHVKSYLTLVSRDMRKSIKH